MAFFAHPRELVEEFFTSPSDSTWTACFQQKLRLHMIARCDPADGCDEHQEPGMKLCKEASAVSHAALSFERRTQDPE